MSRKFCRAVDTVNEWVGRVFAFLFIPMTIFVISEVLLRYFFNKPTIWVWDINVYLGLTLAMLGGGYALLYGMHVIVDIVATRVRPKVRAMVDIGTSLIFFFAIGMILWFAVPEAMTSLAGNERLSTVLGPPLFPVRLITIIGYVLILLQGVVKFIRNIEVARGAQPVSTTMPVSEGKS